MSLTQPLPSLAGAPPARPTRSLDGLVHRLIPALTAAALLLALALRLSPALRQPMWLDEAWTGMIASQHGFGAMLRQVRDDANAPLYYVVIWAWAKLAGVSDLALRAPNLVFGLGAAAVALLQRRAIGARTATTWGVLLALWWPPFDFNASARCYTLLVLLSTAATAAHVRLLQRPTLRRALVWATAATLTIMTHYHAALLVLTQGLALALVHRARLIRLWPAALAFAPGIAWGVYHLPRLVDFARPDVAWYPLLRASDLNEAIFFVCGGPLAAAAALVLGGYALVLGRQRRGAETSSLTPAIWTVVASVAAVGLCLGAAALRPSFTLRYLMPFGPGVLLGVALLSDKVSKRLPLVGLLIPATFVLTAVQLPPTSAPFGFELASRYLQEAAPRRLEFFWDHPATQVESPDQLRRVGGFFFARAGHPIAVDPIIPAPGGDPAALMAGRGGRGSAILWLYSREMKGVAARSHPPSPLQHDPRWRCRDFGDPVQVVLACAPA